MELNIDTNAIENYNLVDGVEPTSSVKSTVSIDAVDNIIDPTIAAYDFTQELTTERLLKFLQGPELESFSETTGHSHRYFTIHILYS